MLRFDPKTGLSVDDVSTVREIVRQDWVSAFQRDGEPTLDTEPETPAGQLIDSQTAHIVEKDNELLYLANQFNPLQAEGKYQDALAKIYFLSRKRELASVAVCRCMGIVGTVISEGVAIRNVVDRSLWHCQETVTIPAEGEVTAIFVRDETGPHAAAAGTLTEIVTITPGWDAVTNPDPAVVGRNIETQMEFEQRRYDSVAVNARGSLSALYAAVSAVEGVIDSLVLENTNDDPVWQWGVQIPGHSVWISAVGGDDDEIAEAIYRKKDAGCGTAGAHTVTYQDQDQPGQPEYLYHICRPDPLQIKLRVTIQTTPSTPAGVEDTVKAAIIQNFQGYGPHGTPRVGMAQSVYASRFACSVVQVAKVASLETIEIATDLAPAWVDHIDIMADQTPVIDESDIDVVLV